MAIPMTYSRRKRLRDQAGEGVELRTSTFGNKLLTQLFQLFLAINNETQSLGSIFAYVVEYVRSEKGVMGLAGTDNLIEEFYSWWISETYATKDDHDFRLDAIELFCVRPFELMQGVVAYDPTVGITHGDPIRRHIAAINARMMEDGFGYQFEGGQIIELTSQFAYERSVEPTLRLLRNPVFAAADQEFRDGLAEFRAGNFDDCIADCGNALESVLKVIASTKGWQDTKPSDRAAQLIDAAVRNNLFPTYMQSQISGLKNVLIGTATLRNNAGGHGQGETLQQIPKHLAAYQINQTAAAIVFLAESAGL